MGLIKIQKVQNLLILPIDKIIFLVKFSFNSLAYMIKQTYRFGLSTKIEETQRYTNKYIIVLQSNKHKDMH
jgi:hypothetical protein